MFLIFDTETTGLPVNYKAPLTDFDNWPRMVQLAWQIHDRQGNLIEAYNFIVKPEGFTIPYQAEKVHGISTEMALREGKDLAWVLEEFEKTLQKTKFLIGHNIEFDINILACEHLRKDFTSRFLDIEKIDTKETSTEYCALPGGKGGKYKWPNLSELHEKLFHEGFEEAHNASADVAATSRCFLELLRLEVIKTDVLGEDASFLTEFRKNYPDTIPPIDITVLSHKKDTKEADYQVEDSAIKQNIDQDIKDIPYTHLHVHTQYSILDGAANIPGLIAKAKEDGMVALAITDHGNMFGAKEFHNIAVKNKIKPLLGCEVYVARRSRHDKSEKQDGGGYHLVLLAKNKTGYHNLVKLVSYGWTEGFYYKPRIDKQLLKEYNEGLIACSACLNGEIPYALRHDSIDRAREIIEEYKQIFGEDFYLELQRHPSGDPQIDKEVYEDQMFVNEKLIELARQTDTRVIATNDVHFLNAEDAEAHDRLLCISTGKDIDDPNRMRYTRQEWMKSQQEMRELFSDIPEALTNTMEVVNKVEAYKLDSEPIMPDFPIPEEFENADNYLRHITYKGAEERYSGITDKIKERIDFELETIQKMGFPGYFLIVWDFLKAARELGVSVGPGRGSAAGSVVAYCLKITDIDPIKYDLLFERFLNPDRVSMPDIDIDFDEDGRDKVLQWVVRKYGEKKVAHIITFGTMAPKMAIRDVARVQKLDLSEADRLAKLVPERPGTSFKKAYEEVPELGREKQSPNELIASTLRYAEVLEGSVRQTGVHACGIIISKNNLEEHIPISINKDADLYVTQYDGKHIESVGMLKMDFLGLKTLSIIKDTVKNIKHSKGIEIHIDSIPLDDEKTFELYSRGDTTGLFQFESPGMKKHLRSLKPNRFEDLIAMNALYRPGPMEYIPSFIARKHGKEKIVYDLPEMEEYLRDTYGITVYQEQVMLLSQKLAGFTKGMADSLRKAMGKKIKSMMDDLKEKFIEGCLKNGYDEDVVKKIWKDWEAFAQYAFNKSHSTCYAWVSYQTAYLKAHYPAEFMAAVLSRNLSDIKKITFFMDECRRMGLHVLVPDINESRGRFVVNKEGDIRFGLAAIKGLGESAVDHIIEERTKEGNFKDIYDLVERVNLTTVNKKSLEALVLSGGFDSFQDIDRYQYFIADKNNLTFIDHLIKYGNLIKNQMTMTLFSEDSSYQDAQKKPAPMEGEEWPHLEQLNKEKELIGIYLSSHPLDNYTLEINNFITHTLSEIQLLDNLNGKEIAVAGIVTEVKHLMTKNGKPFGSFSIEDYTDNYRFVLFGKDYEDFRKYMYTGYSVLVKGLVQENPWRKENRELEIKVKAIHMLSNIKDELVKNITLKMSLELITDDLIEQIKNYTEQRDARVPLKFTVFDPEENLYINMFSRNNNINLTKDFVSFIENHPDIEYQVN